MSDSKPSGQPDQASGESQDSVKYETFSKVLGEKKKLQQENAEAKAQLQMYEQEKLEAEGKLKEANENLKKLLAQSKTEKVELFRKVSTKGVKNQFEREAEKLGCVDTDTAFKVVDFNDLEITDDFEFDSKKLQAKIQDLTKSKPFLFKKDFQLPPDLVPSGNGAIPKKGLSEMSTDELKQLLAKAK